MPCGGPDGAYNSSWDRVPISENTLSITSSTKTLLGVFACSMTFCSIDDICADNHNYFQFKVKGKGRSAGGADPQVLFVD